MTFLEYLNEVKIIGKIDLEKIVNRGDLNKPLKITKEDLKKLEKILDKKFKDLNIDVDILGKHFIDRVNDLRNGKPISIKEIEQIFLKLRKKFGKQLKSPKTCGDQKVVTDKKTFINIPFILKCRKSKSKIKDLIGKTIMRKKNFKTSNQKLVV